MKTDFWYDSFLSSISEKFPKKAQFVEDLKDLLHIEKEAVYRRLRKEVLFSMSEIIKMAQTYNISLDNLIGNKADMEQPFHFNFINLYSPSELNFKEMEKFVTALKNLKDKPESEYMEVCNQLPSSLFAGFPQIARFYLFKWLYRYGEEETMPSFGDMKHNEALINLV